MSRVVVERKRRGEHITIAGDEMLCQNCGATYRFTLPTPIDMFVAQSKAWTKMHTNCAKREGVNLFPRAASVEEWISGRDTGTSSTTIWRHMRGLPSFDPTYPLDPSDFGRCYRLLDIAPEWRRRIGEMAAFGPVWARLAADWDNLTALYEAEVDVSVSPHRARGKDGCAHRLYERMKDLENGRDLNQTDLALSSPQSAVALSGERGESA